MMLGGMFGTESGIEQVTVPGMRATKRRLVLKRNGNEERL